MPNPNKWGCALSVTFDFPIYGEHTAPSFNEDEWVAVPPIMEMLKAAKPFFNKSPFSHVEEFSRFVHLVDGRIYGCTGQTAVEFKVDETGLPGIAFAPEDITVLAAFRQEVTHISISDKRVVFRFASGEKYEAALISYPADRYKRMFAKHWQMGNDLFDATACRKEFVERFSTLPANSRIEVQPRGFVGFPDDAPGYKTILDADTRATETLLFKAPELILAMKIADRIDFTGGDATFALPEGRGFTASLTVPK
jgi:hypothetical protein